MQDIREIKKEGKRKSDKERYQREMERYMRRE